MNDTIAATEGRTATYLREVVRRAALLAAEREADGALRVDGTLLAEAAQELLDDRAALTRALLGGADEPDGEPPTVAFQPGGFYQPGPGTTMPPMVALSRRMRRVHLGGGPGDPGEPTPFAPDH